MDNKPVPPQIEATFLLDISHLKASAGCPEDAFVAMGEAAVQFPGVRGLALELAGGQPLSPGTGQWFGSPDPEACAATQAPILASGQNWGSLSLYFDPHVLAEHMASRISRFLGQQFALALACIELEALISGLRSEVAAGQEEIRGRKALHRAAVLLAHSRGISEKSAQVLIEEQSRRTGKSINAIAEAVLVATSHRLTGSPVWRDTRFRKTA